MGENPIGTRHCFTDMTLSLYISTKVTANHMVGKEIKKQERIPMTKLNEKSKSQSSESQESFFIIATPPSFYMGILKVFFFFLFF